MDNESKYQRDDVRIEIEKQPRVIHRRQVLLHDESTVLTEFTKGVRPRPEKGVETRQPWMADVVMNKNNSRMKRHGNEHMEVRNDHEARTGTGQSRGKVTRLQRAIAARSLDRDGANNVEAANV
jgi:hypothetical protein